MAFNIEFPLTHHFHVVLTTIYLHSVIAIKCNCMTSFHIDSFLFQTWDYKVRTKISVISKLRPVIFGLRPGSHNNIQFSKLSLWKIDYTISVYIMVLFVVEMNQSVWSVTRVLKIIKLWKYGLVYNQNF